MKHIYTFSFLSLYLVFCAGCVEDPTLPDKVRNAVSPAVSTGQISSKQAQSVILSGQITKDGGAPVEEYGVYWSTETPVNEQSGGMKKIVVENKKYTLPLDYEIQIDGLSKNTQYYLCAFARNSAGTSYGQEVPVNTTDGLGTVTTLKPDNVKAESALSGGLIDKNDRGEGEIIARGVYLTNTATGVRDSLASPMQTDSFVCELSGLVPGTYYYVQAFVTNAFGTFSGDRKGFTTTSGKPTVTSLLKEATEYTDATFRAAVTAAGDAPVSARGFCYGTEEMPEVGKNDTIHCGEGTGSFRGTISRLESQKKYNVRAFAVNAYGIGYSDETVSVVTKSEAPTLLTGEVRNTHGGTISISMEVVDQGMSPLIAAGICWSTHPKPTRENGTFLPLSSGDLGTFEGSISELRGGVTYYLRAYAITNLGTFYDETNVATFVAPAVFETKATFTGTTRLTGSAAYFTVGEKGYLLGGDTGPSVTNEFNVYAATDDRWNQLSPYPLKLKGMTTIPYDTKVVVFGGFDQNAKPTDGFFYCNLSGIGGNTWEQITREENAEWPTPRYYAMGCKYGDYIYMIGGISNAVTNEVWSYRIINKQWKKSNAFPEKQYGGIAVVIGEALYVGLGMNETGITATSSKKLWASSGDMSSWQEQAKMPAQAGNVQAGVAFDGNLFVADDRGYIWKYNVALNSWTRKSQLPAANREVHGMYAIGGKIYIGLGNTANKLIAYDPAWDF